MLGKNHLGGLQQQKRGVRFPPVEYRRHLGVLAKRMDPAEQKRLTMGPYGDHTGPV